MARANTPTLMPLDQWAEVMGVNPWEFNQIGSGYSTWVEGQCDAVWYQYSWQRDFLSREELAQTIAGAERWISEYLGYYIAPQYIINEVHRYPRPYKTTGFGRMGTPRGQWKQLSLDWGYVVSGGTRARTLLDDDAAVTFSDEDGDGVEETFTATVATTITDADEIGVYFSEADRLGQGISEIWRIRPVLVSISGGVATVKGHASLLVDPAKTQATKPDNLSAAVAANFVDTVALYRVYTDITATDASPQQGWAIWRAEPNNTGAALTTPITLVDADADAGDVEVQVATFKRDREPDAVKVNYLAGIPLVNGRVAHPFDQMVAYLATSMLTSEKCGCERSNHILRHWRTYPSEETEDTGRRPLTLKEVDENPFGAKRGARHAWKLVQQLASIGVTLP